MQPTDPAPLPKATWVSVPVAAKYLGAPLCTVYRWAQEGKFGRLLKPGPKFFLLRRRRVVAFKEEREARPRTSTGRPRQFKVPPGYKLVPVSETPADPGQAGTGEGGAA